MTDTTTRTGTPDRLVIAPEGMVWFTGNDEIPAEWVNEDEFLPGEYLPVEIDLDGGLDRYVRVPADEPASKADLMSLAADVVDLKEQLRTLMARLQAASAALDVRRPDRRKG